jgi:hypothetical protein
VKITKLEAARRQLQTAIELWRDDGDAVAIHTLAHASHELIHDLSRTGRGKKPLLFDAYPERTDKEFRRQWAAMLKRAAGFFKHTANEKGANTEVDFEPEINEIFMHFSIIGLEAMGVQLNEAESIFSFWMKTHHPEVLSQDSQRFMSESLAPGFLPAFRKLPKKKFFEITTTFLRSEESGVTIPR